VSFIGFVVGYRLSFVSFVIEAFFDFSDAIKKGIMQQNGTKKAFFKHDGSLVFQGFSSYRRLKNVY